MIDYQDVIDYFNNNGKNKTKTCNFFHIGHQRLDKILANPLYPLRKRKTSQEQDDFIIQCARNGLLSEEIVDAFFTKYHLSISHDTVTRRLHEKGFSFLKPRVIQRLKPDQIFVRYNFAMKMSGKREIFHEIIFSDESRFTKTPDNKYIWRKPNDY